jgi:hypothetical protein
LLLAGGPLRIGRKVGRVVLADSFAAIQQPLNAAAQTARSCL